MNESFDQRIFVAANNNLEKKPEYAPSMNNRQKTRK